MSEPPPPQSDVQSILLQLRTALEEIAVEMLQVQWRVAKLERLFGVPLGE
jgi:hypothetical protein